MARKPKPWWRKDRRSWYVTINGVRHNLGPDKDSAHTRFHQLMASPRQTPRRQSDDSILALLDAFLEWTHNNRAERTYEWYLARCQSFASSIERLTVSQLRPFHIQEWIDAHPTWSDRHKRGCITAIQRAFRWAQKMGHVDENPIAHIEKPPAGKRDFLITVELYAQLLSEIADQRFRDLVEMAWETGARPQELLAVEARHVDLKNARWVFPKEEAKIKTRPRIVYLSEQALSVTKRLMLKHSSGRLFRNRNNDPWTTMAVNCQFNRLQTRVGRKELTRRGIDIRERDVKTLAAKLTKERRTKRGIEAKTQSELLCEARRKLRTKMAGDYAPKICLYLFRHAFATRMLQAGIDALTVAVLLGHSNPATLSTTYQHLSHNPQHLSNQLKRAAAS